jgi:hypothetical protein
MKPNKNPNPPFLQELIDEHRLKALHVVFKLTLRKKYIIVHGKSLGGSLYFIQLGYIHFGKKKNQLKTLYVHFYRHVLAHPRSIPMVEVLFETSDQFELLKVAQQELDKARFRRSCLNNTIGPYIPLYNEEKGQYGWMDKSAVLSFRKWQKRRPKPTAKAKPL